MNRNEPPHKAPKNGGKTCLFNTFATLPDTQKQTTISLKPEKERNKKTPSCHVQKQPTIFHIFFFQPTALLLQLLCFAENTIKIVFSEEHSFSKTQLVKPSCPPMSKTPFPTKDVIFGFGQFPLNPLFLQLFLIFTVLVQTIVWAKTDSVHENAFLSPFLTQIVSGNLC